MINAKFRGKQIDTGEWICGYYFKTPLTDEATNSKSEDGWYFLTGRERHCISRNSCVYEVIPETITQYTGMNDKNNIEIYEGDIVKFEDIGEEGYEYKEGFDFINYAYIKWEDGRYIFESVMSTNSGVIEEMNNCPEDFYEEFRRCEVIGNIYENTELISEE